jgi:hypothetical protein
MNEQDRAFLQSQTRQDIEHEPGACGHCEYRRLMAEVAREILASGDTDNGIARWADEVQARWASGVFRQLHDAAVASGKDPATYIRERGLIP